MEKYAAGLQLVGLNRNHSTIMYIVQTPCNVVAPHATVIHGVGSLRFTGAVSSALYAGDGPRDVSLADWRLLEIINKLSTDFTVLSVDLLLGFCPGSAYTDSLTHDVQPKQND